MARWKHLGRGVRLLLVWGVALALMAAGLWRILGEMSAAEHARAQADVIIARSLDKDERFAPLRSMVPPDAVVGYFDPEDSQEGVRFAQLSLVPALVEPGDAARHRWLMLESSLPDTFPPGLAEQGFDVVTVLPNGLTLLRKREP